MADYLGSVYATNKVFDNSYDRGQPAGFEIGTGKVIKGWDETLVRVNAGSRILILIPPAKGYGTEGNEQAGIKGTNTLVFVVDVIASYGKDATKPEDTSTAVTGLSPKLPKVEGAQGVAPKLTVAKGSTPPTAPSTTVIAKGTGKPLAKGKPAIVQDRRELRRRAARHDLGGRRPARLRRRDRGPGDAVRRARGRAVGSRVLLLSGTAGWRPEEGQRRGSHRRRPCTARRRKPPDEHELRREAGDRFPEGQPPVELEITDVTVGNGDEATPGHTAACTTSASRTRPARSSTPPGTAASLRSHSAEAASSRAGTRGVAGMKVGGRRKLVIPPHLGYGDRGAGREIKPGETLIFVVDLLDLR